MEDAGTLRKRILALRQALPEASRLELNAAIARHLERVAVFRNAGLVLSYVSRGSEVGTLELMRWARLQGKAVAAPRCDPAARAMRFHVLEREEALEPGPYGIPQPPKSAPLARPDAGAVVLVPGSAFDWSGNRLGLGAGYYDRWLAGEGKGLTTLGLAFEVQVLPEVPAQAWDVPVDWLVTERGGARCLRP